MKNLLFLVLSLMIVSCDKDEDSGPAGTNIDLGLRIYLQNNEGIDLLDTPNYMSDNFKLFYIVDGQPQYAFNGYLDNPRHFAIFQDTISKSMLLGLSDHIVDEYSETFIKWNETETDTLRAQIYQGGGYIGCKKLWLNEELVWDSTTANLAIHRTITIIK